MMAPLSLPPTVHGSKLTTAGPATTASSASSQSTSTAWGDMQSLQRTIVANGLNATTPLDLAGPSDSAANSGLGEGETQTQRNPPMPVTTSTLLHVLDRMPEIKNKIQAILNRTDCSESQKVAMIARLLSNTNAINNNTTSDPLVQPDAAAASSSAVLSALTADAAMLSSSGMLIDTETAIPMPASLAASSVSNASVPATSSTSASASSGQLQPPASQS